MRKKNPPLSHRVFFRTRTFADFLLSGSKELALLSVIPQCIRLYVAALFMVDIPRQGWVCILSVFVTAEAAISALDVTAAVRATIR